MNAFLVNIALGLFLSEVASATASLDPKGIEASVNARINAVVTDTKIQPTIDGLVDGAIELAFAAVRDESDLKQLASDAVSGKWANATADLKALMAKALPSLPTGPVMAELEAILGGVA